MILFPECIHKDDGLYLLRIVVVSRTSIEVVIYTSLFVLLSRRKETNTRSEAFFFFFFLNRMMFFRLCLTRIEKARRTIVLPSCRRLLKLVQDRRYPPIIKHLKFLPVQWDNWPELFLKINNIYFSTSFFNTNYQNTLCFLLY